jgi:hypothetical protein
MTEPEWLACATVGPMQRFLFGKLSDRKTRLFGCACCRHIWHLVTDPQCRTAVEVAEQFADGLVTRKTLSQARHAVRTARRGTPCGAALNCVMNKAVEAGWYASDDATTSLALSPVYHALEGPLGGKWDYYAAMAAAEGEIVTVLKELVGNPFRRVAIDTSWLAWNGGTVVKLAQAIYNDRAFDRLPILADALEDAGCTNADILSHCRGGGVHVRGCWVVDLLLARE